MKNKLTLQDLLEVQQFFGLPSPALVEKDWYVVQALAAIASIEAGPLRLVFGGGTALSRAHRLIRRMSEDVDLKIVAVNPARAQLRALRDQVTTALKDAGFEFDSMNRDHRNSQNETRYTIFRLPYEPNAAGEGVLKPTIQIELALWPLLRPDVKLPVTSFVTEAVKGAPEVESIACVSVTQTAAEKFVALTRRIAAQRAQGGEHDATLLRHIYDLWAIRKHHDFVQTAGLIPALMQSDTETFGKQFPEYRVNPVAETQRALQALSADPDYSRQFALFQRDMVYGDKVEFGVAMRTLNELFEEVGKRG
ncbi:MAG: nucleotidyl transferase AbiEii/AbiGii toxin family protein [Steroidobacteraceae bacterium]